MKVFLSRNMCYEHIFLERQHYLRWCSYVVIDIKNFSTDAHEISFFKRKELLN